MDSHSGDDSDRDRKHRRKASSHKRKKRHHKRRREQESEESEDSYSSSDDSSSYERRKPRRKEEKKKKKRKHRKESKHHKKKKKSKRDDKSESEESTGAPSFGKYGILKASDYNRVQRGFEVWMSEVKGIAAYNGPKWELQKYFEEFREDFNTATLPHKKYYDYDNWEIAEYKKQKQTEAKVSSKSIVLADEAKHRDEIRRRAADQERKALNLVKSTMSREKVESMKRQAELRAQMQIAFKMGDKKKYERLKERLAADE